ncbi:MAG: hypothetical protein AB6733_10855 [Clostridiaceae bacterium]
MSNLTPKELADKTVKDLKQRKIKRQKQTEQDVMYMLIENKAKIQRRKIGQL